MFEDIIGGNNQSQACKAQPADPIVNHLRLFTTHITNGISKLPDFKKQHFLISDLLKSGIDVKVIKRPTITTISGLVIATKIERITCYRLHQNCKKDRVDQVLFYNWFEMADGHQHVDYCCHPNVFKFDEKDLFI